MLFAISILYSIKRGTQVFLVGIDSLPKCYSGKHFLSPRAQIALLFGPRETYLPNLGPPLAISHTGLEAAKSLLLFN